MFDIPNKDIILPFKKGGKIKKIKQKRQDLKNPDLTSNITKYSLMKQRQKQRQTQTVNIHLGSKVRKPVYTRRQQKPQRSTNANALQLNQMPYFPPITTIIQNPMQNPNQPQQLPSQLPDMMTMLRALNLKGEKGDTGAQGPQGIQGIQGLTGLTGPQGNQGIQGLRGEMGLRGHIGETGPQGNQGIQGEKGDMGLRGYRGEQGIQGIKGDQGNQGLRGEAGPQGIQGIQGIKGDQGNQGIAGEAGPQGIQGPQGIAGYRGLRGPQGEKAVYNPTLEELELQEFLRVMYAEQKRYEDTGKSTREDLVEKMYKDNYFEEDIKNEQIRDTPMTDPTQEDNRLPSLSLTSTPDNPFAIPPPEPVIQSQLTNRRISKKTLPELQEIVINNGLYGLTSAGRQGVPRRLEGQEVRNMTADELRDVIREAQRTNPNIKIYP